MKKILASFVIILLFLSFGSVFAIEEKNVLSKKDEMEEFIFMGLRMNEGINLDEFYEKFNVNFKHKYNNILDKLKNLNLIIEQKNNIALTQRGRELSNTVFIEFID